MSKTYVISGATSGIGKALLEKLAENNVVFAGYRSEEKLELLEQISPNIQPFYVDYSKPETIAASIEFIKSKTNKIDTLINVAGCVVAGPIEKISIDEIKRQFNVNVFGHIEMMQGLAQLLENGKIINVSSMASYGIFLLYRRIAHQSVVWICSLILFLLKINAILKLFQLSQG